MEAHPVRYACKKCDAVFRTRGQVIDHVERKHKHIKYPGRWVDQIVVNGYYIKQRKLQCRTKIAVFGHGQEHSCGETMLIPNSCQIRNCPKCLGTRKARVAKNYKNITKHWPRTSLLTLTVGNYHPLGKKKEIERWAKEFWRRVRRLYPNYRIQYMRALHCNKKTDGYYYHLHFLADMPYIQQRTLSRIWNDISGYIVVDIRNVTRMGKNAASWYVARYVAEPMINITDDEYSLHVYSKHFIERVISPLLDIRAELEHGLRCKVCQDRLFFRSYEETPLDSLDIQGLLNLYT